MEEKIRSYINIISIKYYDLIKLELNFFKYSILIHGAKIDDIRLHLTTSGNDTKINQRRKILADSFIALEKTTVDAYFLTLANLFEDSKRNKPISVLALIRIISNNVHLFVEKKDIESHLNVCKSKIMSLNDLIERIREHRDKCIAHNDSEVVCNHLINLTTIETREIMDVVKFTINSFSPYFNSKKIEESEIQRMQNESFHSNYKLIESLEK